MLHLISGELAKFMEEYIIFIYIVNYTVHTQ